MAEGRVLALAAVSLPRLLIVAYLRESLLYERGGRGGRCFAASVPPGMLLRWRQTRGSRSVLSAARD